MNDVAKRLNRWLETSLRGDEIPDSWVEEAANEIERLTAQWTAQEDVEGELRAMNDRLLAQVEKLRKDNELLSAINRLTVQ